MVADGQPIPVEQIVSGNALVLRVDDLVLAVLRDEFRGITLGRDAVHAPGVAGNQCDVVQVALVNEQVRLRCHDRGFSGEVEKVSCSEWRCRLPRG